MHRGHRLWALFVPAWVVVFGLGVSASASSIGPACGTCQGSTYSIATTTVTPILTTASTETWDVAYTIDTSGYSGGGTHLNQVALKVSSSIISGSLVSAPGGTGDWNVIMGGINASGCSMAGSGFDCASATSVAVSPVVPGGTFTWVFQLTLPTGGLLTGANESSLKARYVDDSGNKVGALVSESITLTVPEPSTVLLLGAAAVLMMRRRAATTG